MKPSHATIKPVLRICLEAAAAGDQQRDEIAETKPGANNCFCNRISVPADDANGVTPPPSAESQ
jgi:hypothetical protein